MARAKPWFVGLLVPALWSSLRLARAQAPEDTQRQNRKACTDHIIGFPLVRE